MKIDRRDFLSLGIGAAAGIGAGTALSPLPWKLIDDSSIWSQNWPWTPVPPDGAVSFKNSVCTLCPGGCGITVRKVEDRCIKIEGTKGNIVNNGGICILGLSGLQLLYGPTRVKAPMKKDGGRWKEISWDSAIDEIVKRLKTIREEGKPESVACVSGTDQGTVAQLIGRFLTAYGSPNYIRTSSIADSYEITLKKMHGQFSSIGFDFENSDFVLSFGSGVADGWGSPVRMFKANSKWKDSKNKALYQIESRLSNTAAKADKWIAIIPGTEAILAIGIASVIIQKSLYKKKLIEKYSKGFNDFKVLVLKEYSPEKVSKITGVKKSEIIAIAKKFADASNPVAICGSGQGRTPGNIFEFMAVHALNALTGSINNIGGVFVVPEPDYIKWPEAEKDDVAVKGIKKDRIDGAGKKYPDTRYVINRLIDSINSTGDSPVELLFVNGANPCYAMPDTENVIKAFKKIPYVVSFSSYFDETTEMADIILPNHTNLERLEDIPLAAGLIKPVVGLSMPVVEPEFNTRHIGDVFIQMAKLMDGNIKASFPWNNYEECLKKTLDDKWDKLAKDGYWVDENSRASRGKFEFTPLVKNNRNLVKPEGKSKLTLIPYDSMRLTVGYIGDPPFAMKTVEDTVLKGNDVFVEINPKTAADYNLSEGDKARLTTSKGEAKVRVHLYDGIRPGIVAMPRGLGHTEFDEYLAGKGENFNKLIGPVEDPVSGLDAAWGIQAEITKT